MKKTAISIRTKRTVFAFLGIAIVAITGFFIYQKFFNQPKTTAEAPKLKVQTDGPQKTPEKYFLTKKSVESITSNKLDNSLPQLVKKTNTEGKEDEYLAYYHYKQDGKDIVLYKTENGIQKYEFNTSSLSVRLLEIEDNEKTYKEKAIANPIYQFKENEQWKDYPVQTPVNIEVKQEQNHLTLWQKTQDIEVEWIFGVENQAVLKNTFRLANQQNINRMIWSIELLDKENRSIKENNKDATNNGKKAYNMLRFGDVEINWNDFNDGKTRAEINQDTQQINVFFYEEGKPGALNIDPTFTTTVTSTPQVQVDDGTRMWCFGRGGASTANQFWQPARFFHDSAGAPTSCTSGGDNLLPAANATYDGLFDYNDAYADSSSNSISLLETTPTRAVIQTFRDATRDSRGKFTVYPSGTGYLHYALGDITASDTDAAWSVHYDTATPQAFNYDSTNLAWYISDTSNNNYAGVSFIPYTLISSPNFNTQDIPGTIGDNNSWYVVTGQLGGVFDDINQTMVVDWSTYRATTASRDYRRADYRTPDIISDGLSNGVLWDQSGETSYFFTGFEDADSNLCGGGDGFDTGSCNVGDTAVGNSTSNPYLGTYHATFDGDATGTDVAYAQETVTTAPITGMRFALNIDTETLSDTNDMTIATFTNGGTTVSSLQVLQSSGNLVLCVTSTSQTCGTTALSTDTWYQVEFISGENNNIDGNAAGNDIHYTAAYLNGALETSTTTGTSNAEITTARIGLVATDVGNNTIHVDNVAINQGATGPAGYNPTEGTYTVQHTNWGEDLKVEIDRNNYQATGSALLVRGWKSLNDPAQVKLEDRVLINGTDYNTDVAPISESWVSDSDGTCGTSGLAKLAEGGDDSDSDEYLNDNTNDFDFGSTSSCTWGDSSTDALYFGRTDRFSGLNISLATLGVGTPTVTWEYCSANTDLFSACDTWSTLTVTDTTSGASTFTASGNFYFTPPSQWVRSTEGRTCSTVNNCRELMYTIRARVTAGSYSTYPVEDQIKSDILVFQYQGTLQSNNQAFVFKTKAPVAEWKMDNGTSTIGDNTGLGNSLTVSGATWRKNNKETNRETYLEFDGSNDFASRLSDTDFNFGTESFSVTGWFRHPTAVSGTDTIISRASAVNGIGYKVYMNSSGNICFGIDDTAGSFPEDSACTTTTYIDSTWHHFAAIKTSNSSITIYIDGKNAVSDSSIGSTETLDASQTLYVGIDGDGSSNPWAGDLDNITVYSYALSQAEIYADIPDPTGALLGANASDPLANGLVGWWKMDETSANGCTGGTNDSCDSSGNGNDGAWNGNATAATGKFDSSVTLDGDGDYIQVSGMFSNPANITLAGWINLDDLDTSGADFISLGDNVAIRFESGEINGFFNANFLTYNTNIVDTGWRHVAFTVDDANNLQNLYLDGKLIYTASLTDSIVYNSGGTNTTIGRHGNGNTNYDLNGEVDDIRVYNRALSGKEIEQLASWGPGPIGYWKLDENTGSSTTNDSSANGYNGTMSGLASNWTRGKYGSAIEFNGGSHYIDLYSSGLSSSFNENIGTLSVWVKIPAAVWTDNTSRNAVTFRVDGSNQIEIGKTSGNLLRTAYQAGGVTSGRNTSTTPTDWTHVAISWNKSTDEVRHYINGVIVEIDTGLGTWSGSLASNGAVIGARNTAAADPWSGTVDDVRLYNYARSQAQIIEDMNASHPIIGTPVSGAVGHWSFNEGYGITAQDKSPNDNDLTLSSASWTNDAKYGKAWNGTGTNWSSRADDADFDFNTTEDFSISMWFRSDSTTNPSTTEWLLNKSLSGGTQQAGYAMYANTDGTACFAIDDDTTWSPDVSVCSSTDVYDATWHHMLGIRNASTDTLYLYIDGKLVDSDSDTTTATLENALILYIGDRQGADGGDEFNGDIDELKIYRAALSPSDVLLEYNQAKAAVFGATSTASDGTTVSNASSREYCVPGDTTSCSPPVGEWKLDERTGTSANDTSGNDNTLTLTNSPTFSTGKFGAGINFQGSNAHLIRSDDADFDFTAGASFTLEAWVKHNTASVQEIIISKHNEAGYKLLMESDGDITCGIDYDSTWTPTDSVTSTAATYDDNTWHHIVCVKNANTSITLYIDGQSVGTPDTSLTNSTLANSDPLYIGIDADGTSNDWIGDMDNIRIFNTAISPSQIAWLYNRGAPVAYYKMDECTGTTIYDSALTANGAATGNNGTWSGSSGSNTSSGSCTSGNSAHVWHNGVTGKFNSSLDFDGTDDQVNAGSASIIDNLTQKTVSAWIYPDGFGEGNLGRIIDKGTVGSSSSRGWALFTCTSSANCNSNSLTFFQDFNSDVNPGWWSTPANSISTGQWIHVAGSFDKSSSSNDPTLYINGKQVAVTENVTPSGTSDNDSAFDLFIGNRSGGDRTFDGRIDDVRVYNYLLTATQIKTVYNEGAAVRFGPQTGSP